MKGEDQRDPRSPPTNEQNQNAPPNNTPPNTLQTVNQNAQSNNTPPNTLQTVNQNQELPQLSDDELKNIINALKALHTQLDEYQNPPK